MFGLSTKNVNATEAMRLAQEEGALLLDVRESAEFKAGHAPGAQHVPLRALERRVGKLDKNRRIVAVCRSGNRSGTAARFLRKQGFDVANLRGGMIAWERAGLPTRRGR